MKHALMLSVLVLAGCATEANYKKSLQTWVGHSEGELVSSWGVPSSSYAAGDSKILTYNQSMGAQASVIYGTLYARENSCRTNFTVNNVGRVENWSFEGNSCKSR